MRLYLDNNRVQAVRCSKLLFNDRLISLDQEAESRKSFDLLSYRLRNA